ncbi:SusD/RagB family nutrient-binding outer membrane lipoprotein [Tenacibaculum piscium]|uniref:SusD/RagB family nutrient-binding outer membrane lipoprotein n=1 Tax=Tenacibaculum piscium TaxID=1458515 RepID=UPI001EFAB0DA|nr:SusD/RagB family nutrient-binding outer membrane lipoprotein [Tenacibaculum piscium]MCG8183761.1 SusD/RagB family nutrient-binding outer membrane lipoprotein [Tenacibaculum piscium]MCG8205313.1 SusD/RagB family nutrient-binding outer membrane lipoprotein [Tenacibaculum piscium]
MRKIYKQGVLALAISSLLVTSSCDNVESLNTDTKAYTTPIPEALMTSAQVNYNYFLHNASVNDNNFRKYVQQWGGTTYQDEDQYSQSKRDLGNSYYSSLYTATLAKLYESKKFIEAQDTFSADEASVKKNKLAIIEIQIVNVYMTLVDIFGNVPYTEALDLQKYPTPKYDDAKTIYLDLAKRITNAVNSLNTNLASFGGADLIHNGDVAKWKMYGNSLKLKMGLHLADVDATKAKQLVEQAYASGVISSNADNTVMKYLDKEIEQNPLYASLVLESQLVPTSFLVDNLNAKEDPRRDFFFDPTSKIALFEKDSDGNIVKDENDENVYKLDEAGNKIKEYKGALYADEKATFSDYSTQGTALKKKDTEGVIFDYAETSFLLADAASRGFSVGNTAAHYYEQGIKASMDYWGVADADATTYLARTDVAFATATAKQKIAEQLWIAYYNRGLEAWTEYRRLDYPVFPVPAKAFPEAEGKVPVRVIYPSSVRVRNAANYADAASKIGGDKMTTKLFWDKY